MSLPLLPRTQTTSPHAPSVSSNGYKIKIISGKLLVYSRFAPYFEGGSVVEQGGYRIHTFTTSSTLTMVRPGDVEYLVVGRGGNGRGSSISGVLTTYAGGGGGSANASWPGSNGGSGIVIVRYRYPL